MPHDSKAAVPPRRRAELAAIHLGRKQLELGEEEYRGLIQQETGKTSAGDLTAAERGAVLDRMRQLGFARAAASAAAPPKPQVGKALALWRELGNVGALRKEGAGGLAAFVERQVGKTRLEWCTPRELNVVIEGLKGWLARARNGGG